MDLVLVHSDTASFEPLQTILPVELLSIFDKPLVQHQLELAYAQGVRNCTIIASSNLSQIREYCEDGSRFGMRLALVAGASLGGEVESLLKHRHLLSEHCLILGGQTISNLEVARLQRLHDESGKRVSLIRHGQTHEFVALLTSSPRPSDLLEGLTGSLEAAAATLLETCPQEVNVIDEVFAYHSCRSLSDVLGLMTTLLDNPQDFIVEHSFAELSPGVYLGHHVSLSPTAVLRPPVAIGDFCHIMDRAEIGPHVAIGAGTIVAKDAVVRHSVIAPSSYVGEMTRVKEAIVAGSTLVQTATGVKVVVNDPVLLDTVRHATVVGMSHAAIQRAAALGLLVVLAPAGVGLGLISKLRTRHAVSGIETVGRGDAADTSDLRFLPRFIRLELADEKLPLRWYPTLINVAKGQMRFVGPRPLSPQESEVLGQQMAPSRYAVQPGLFPVAGLFEEGSDEARFAEAIYAKKHGVIQDLRCVVAQLVSGVVGRRRARQLAGL